MPELRKDPIIGRWVIISHERGRISTVWGKEPPEEEKICPFCPGNEHLTPPEISAYREAGSKRDGPGWRVRVVPNKYPALMVEERLRKTADGIYDKMDGVGAHEVIIESPDHKKEISALADDEVKEILSMFLERMNDLKKDIRLEYILIFKNKGALAGASQAHPHSQLIAMPMVPLRVKREMEGAKRYYEYKERCIYCDIIRQELSQGVRVICENMDFLAFCPYASRFPFEVCVIPKFHDPRFEDATKSQIGNLARIMKDVLKRIEEVLEDPPYNYLIHTSALREPDTPYYHWHIELMPTLTKVAGFEWGTGFYINPTPPEEAAKFLREAGW